MGPLIYAGIDEAGYGPRLGPLCIAMTVFEIGRWEPAQAAPDLWKMLSRAVCRDAAETRSGLIAINDSKKLKGVGGASMHPLSHLERGVSAFLAARDGLGWPAAPCRDASEQPLKAPQSSGPPQTDRDLLRALGALLPDHKPWYAGEDIALPVTTTIDHVRLLASALRSACEGAMLVPRSIRAHIIDECAFNQGCERYGTKAGVSFQSIACLLREIWDGPARRADRDCAVDDPAPRIVIDRQGGRAYYGDQLLAALPGARIEQATETERHSRYELRGDDGRALIVTFSVEAEQAHFPVALASMTAKFCRELMMMRFNRYWCGIIPELKPTAGYALDAGRWIREVRTHLGDSAARDLIRTS